MILHIREFGKKIDHNICIYVWSDVMVKAVSVMWHAFVFLSSLLMAGLYSRVVYTLWFKRNDDNELTYQQQVCVNGEITRLGRVFHVYPISNLLSSNNTFNLIRPFY